MNRSLSALVMAAASLLAACGGGASPAPDVVPLPVPGQPQIRPLAGTNLDGHGYADGSGAAARFNMPESLALDAGGNLFVSDTLNHVIRKISPAGATTMVAGLAGVPGNSDGAGAAARFNRPGRITIDSADNLFVVDDCAIRKVTPAAVVTTVARLPAGCSLVSVTVDRNGQLYAALARIVYRVGAAGEFIALAGSNGPEGSRDGIGAAASFSLIGAMLVAPSGNLFLADIDAATIRQVTPQGAVTTFAGLAGVTGNVDGPAALARFGVPVGIAVDGAGNLFVTDSFGGVPDRSNHTVRKITPGGAVSTVAGVAGSAGSADGPAAAAQFRAAQGIAADRNGELFVADTANSIIRKISAAGVVSTLAGARPSFGSTDGAVADARFWSPARIALDAAGNRYVADTRNHTVRKIAVSGIVSTLAGMPGRAGSADGLGQAAQFDRPEGLAVDAAGNVYVADTGNATVRRITPAGLVSTFLGTPRVTGDAAGSGAAARLSQPVALALDAAGNLYVADADNDVIYKATPAAVMSVLAGTRIDIRDRNGRRAGRETLDGIGAAAHFFSPVGVAVDAGGAVFVVESLGLTVRRIAPGAVVTTFAGAPGVAGAQDGVGAAARFALPADIAIDTAGNLFVADWGNRAIRKITQAAVVTTYAGSSTNPDPIAKPGLLPGQVGQVSGLAAGGRGLVFINGDGVFSIEP